MLNFKTLFLLIGLSFSFEAFALESVTLQLKWKHQFQFAGYYAAKELGYGRSLNWVDQDSWIIVKGQLWDVNLNPLKDLYVGDIRQVDGYWTRHKLTLLNHKSGHKTEFTFSEVDYKEPVRDSLFSRQALTRGVPK